MTESPSDHLSTPGVISRKEEGQGADANTDADAPRQI